MNKRVLIVGAALSIGLTAALAQTNEAPPLLSVPPVPPKFPTNEVIQSAGGAAVATFMFNLLPGWDQYATNAFGAKELEIEASPIWKSVTAGGSTPYLSIGANYYLTRNFGIGMDAVTFGNGSGSSDIDSVHGFALFRKDWGNVAGHLMLGGGHDVNLSKFIMEAGGGLEYRYSTGIGILVDTRYCYLFENAPVDHEFLTRVGVTIHFK